MGLHRPITEIKGCPGRVSTGFRVLGGKLPGIVSRTQYLDCVSESMVVVYALARCCSVLACQAGLVSGGGCEVTLVYLEPFHPMQMTRRMPEITIPGY